MTINILFSVYPMPTFSPYITVSARHWGWSGLIWKTSKDNTTNSQAKPVAVLSGSTCQYWSPLDQQTSGLLFLWLHDHPRKWNGNHGVHDVMLQYFPECCRYKHYCQALCSHLTWPCRHWLCVSPEANTLFSATALTMTVSRCDNDLSSSKVSIYSTSVWIFLRYLPLSTSSRWWEISFPFLYFRKGTKD